MHSSTSIDDHIAGFEGDVRRRLEKLRTVIKKAAPAAEETINYGIPTFKLNGNLVHFAGYKKHIGFYPGASGIANFQQELKAYVTSKGAIQFAHGQPISYSLVTQIVKFRVAENKLKMDVKAGISKKKVAGKKK